ncbi:MAG: right-handed parallel beta-helix repeat-containing protein, partial [Chitinophagaceae bacterium]
MKLFLLAGLFVFFSSNLFAQKAYYVREDGQGSGLTWTDASGDLQAMINKASEGDSIFVAAGKYIPGRPADQVGLGTVNSTNRDNAFVLKKGVKIFGGFAATGNPSFSARNWTDNLCVLSGDIGEENDNTDNVYHVIISVDDDKATILDGFTISGGVAQEATPYHTTTVEGKQIATNHGGGMCNMASSPTLKNNIFNSNQAQGWGGAIYNANASSPDISYTEFTENAAFNGGAVFNNTSSSPAISHCTFKTNNAGSNGGAMDNELSSSPKITYCKFSENFATKNGGAMANYSHSSPQVTNSLFANNATYGSLNSVVVSGGGAMFNSYACLPIITNCTFSGNKVTFPDVHGGGGA